MFRCSESTLKQVHEAQVLPRREHDWESTVVTDTSGRLGRFHASWSVTKPVGQCNGALRGSRADPTSTLVGRVVLGGRGSVVPQSQLVRWHSCCVARYEDTCNPHLSQILSRYGHHHGSHPIHATLSGGTRPTTDLSALLPGPGCCHVLASWHPSPLPSPCHLLPLPL